MIFWRLCGVFWLGFSLPAMAHTATAVQDRILERAYFKEASGLLDIEQLVLQPFIPLADSFFTGGFGPSAHWLRIVVAPGSSGQAPWVLSIRPNFLDELILFEPDPLAPSGWKRHVTGDRTPWTQRPYHGLTLGFWLTPRPEPTTYYLRLSTTSSALLHTKVLTLQEAQQHDTRLGLFYILHLVLMGWILLWALYNVWLTKALIAVFFVLAHGVYLLFAISHMGYLYPLFEDSTLVDRLTSWLVCLSIFFWLFFHRQMAVLFWSFSITLWVINGLIFGSFTVLVLLLLGHTHTALHLNATIGLMILLPFILIIIGIIKNNILEERAIGFLYFLLALSITSSVLPLLNLINGMVWYLNAPFINGFISGLLMLILLHRHSKRLRKEEAKNRITLEMAAQQLAQEKVWRQEQIQLMGMLTHELNTPLTSIRLSFDAIKMSATEEKRRKRIDRAITDMTVILQRCRQLEHVEYGPLKAQHRRFSPVPWARELVSACRDPERVAFMPDPALPDIVSDSQLLGIALTNLIENALKYSDPASFIQLEMKEKSHETGQTGLLIVLQNTLLPGDLPDPNRVFEKYYRSSMAHSKSGSGLGLYLVRVIMEKLSGRVWCEIQPPHARFFVWVARDSQAAQAPDESSQR